MSLKWEDLNLLRQCIEMEPDWTFEDIAKQVKFSRVYSASELEQCWKQLLYHPTQQQINYMILYQLFVQQKYSHSYPPNRQTEFLQQIVSSVADPSTIDMESLIQEFQFSIFHPLKTTTIDPLPLRKQIIETEKELEMNTTNTILYLESKNRKIALTKQKIVLGRKPKTTVVEESLQEQFIDLSSDLIFENKKEKSISRKQVLITLESPHLQSITIQNIGKKPITVNETTVLEKDQSITLQQLPILLDCSGLLLQLRN